MLSQVVKVKGPVEQPVVWPELHDVVVEISVEHVVPGKVQARVVVTPLVVVAGGV